MALKRTADKIARTQSNGERERKNDAAKENSEGKLDYITADLQMIEDHGRSEHKHKPFHSKREEPCILQLSIDGPDQHRSRKKTSNEIACDQKQDRSDGMSEIRQKREGQSCSGCVRCVE